MRTSTDYTPCGIGSQSGWDILILFRPFARLEWQDELYTPKRRWFQSNAKIIFLAGSVVGAIQLSLALLAMKSIIPYHWKWISHPYGTTTIRSYWDGRVEIVDTGRAAWTMIAELAIWAFLAVGTAGAGYLAMRWVKRNRST